MDTGAGSGYAARVPAEVRRQAILDAALQAWSTGGFEAVTMNDLASRVGVSKPVVYRHFANTTEVLRALVEREAAAGLASAIAQLPRDEEYADPLTATPAALVGYLEAVRENPERWRLLLVRDAWHDPDTRAFVSGTRAFIIGRLTELAGLAFARRAGGALDPEMTAHLIWAGLEEGARLVLDAPDRFPRERVVAFATELVRSIVQG